MPRRTQIYQKLPWTGGINDSVDSGLLPDNDLVQADNVQFSLSGSRLKREGLEYIDSDIPAVTNRASDNAAPNSTRTLTFASAINGTDDIFVVGERITISSTGSGNDATYAATDVVITAVTSTTISYVGTGQLSEGTTATSTLSVVKTSSVIGLHDYWRFASNNTKTQVLLAATDDFQLFSYDSNGNRTQITGELQVTSVTTRADSAGDLDGTYFLIYDSDGSVGVWIDVDDSGTTIPSGASSADRAIEVTGVATGDSATAVATAVAAAIDADSKFSASSASDVITITVQDQGDLTDSTAGDTGFTVSTATEGATAPTSALDKIHFHTMTEKAIISFSGIGNKPCKYNPDTDANYQILGGSPPDFSFSTTWLGRLWGNDKTNPDRVHYSTTGNVEEWNGTGDSGALDFTEGDGDPEGITAIKAFKGILFVWKRDAMYRVIGDSPENFRVELVSDGIGCESQDSVASIDERDLVWVSKRGIHSLSATDAYGDTAAQYLSSKIQSTFNEDLQTGRLKYTQAAYVPKLNSVGFTFSLDSSTSQDTIYFFNTNIGEWYRWPSRPCQSLSTRKVGDVDKLIMGTTAGRIAQAQRGTYTDFSSTGITYRVKSGTIYPDGNPQTFKAFKWLSLFYKPLGGSFQFTVKVKIDNFSAQSYSFSSSNEGDVLGTTFTLGTSVLGSDVVLAPFNTPLMGIGRGMTVEITQTGTGDQVEIYGFSIEYEPADIRPEVV